MEEITDGGKKKEAGSSLFTKIQFIKYHSRVTLFVNATVKQEMCSPQN